MSSVDYSFYQYEITLLIKILLIILFILNSIWCVIKNTILASFGLVSVQHIFSIFLTFLKICLLSLHILLLFKSNLESLSFNCEFNLFTFIVVSNICGFFSTFLLFFYLFCFSPFVSFVGLIELFIFLFFSTTGSEVLHSIILVFILKF